MANWKKFRWILQNIICVKDTLGSSLLCCGAARRSDKSVGDLSRSYKHHNCINGAAADHGEDPELSKEALMNLECGALWSVMANKIEPVFCSSS